MIDERSPAAVAWAGSGAMALTGRTGAEALVAPDGVVERIIALGRRIQVDALALLGERAAAEGLTRGGSHSCGGSARLLAAADGWLVVQLARPEDRDAVAAWLELDRRPEADDLWPSIEREVADRPTAELVERAQLLALPVARAGETADPAHDRDGLPVVATRLAAAPLAPVDEPLVVDLSSLWAGPLCARLLADRGARVVKVESTARPDGARRGAAPFFDRLHAGHRSVGLDLTSPDGHGALRQLLGRADVVIEASRPRALRAMGIEVDEVVASGRCRAWVAITGFGRTADRVAFGDDAAVAGGLVAFDAEGPCFVADAVADPLAGIVATAAVEAALSRGGSWLLDVSMAGVAAHVAGPDRCSTWRGAGDLAARQPSLHPTAGSAAALGADNDEVAAELGISLGPVAP